MRTGAHRLSTGASQAVFRVLLDALAHPGRVLPLPPDLLADRALPPALIVPLALADLSQSVAVTGAGADRGARLVATATSCRLAEPDAADQVVVLDGASPALVATLRRGSAMAPEEGCRLALACRALHAGGGGDVTIDLRGPGVEDTGAVGVDGIDAAVVAALAEANADFPAGVDTWLVADGGDVVGFPRSLTLGSPARVSPASGVR